MQKEGAGVDRRAGFMAKAVVELSGRRVQPLSEVRSLVLKWGMVGGGGGGERRWSGL